MLKIKLNHSTIILRGTFVGSCPHRGCWWPSLCLSSRARKKRSLEPWPRTRRAVWKMELFTSLFFPRNVKIEHFFKSIAFFFPCILPKRVLISCAAKTTRQQKLDLKGNHCRKSPRSRLPVNRKTRNNCASVGSSLPNHKEICLRGQTFMEV